MSSTTRERDMEDTDIVEPAEEENPNVEEEEVEEEEEEDNEEEEEEEEEGEGEGEGEEEDVEDGEYTLRFDGEMNPLDFAEDDEFGVQPYQQFERLEYNTLAERKRKALSERQRDGSAKKAKVVDDGCLTNFDEMMREMGYGKRRRRSRKSKKRGRRKGSKRKLSPEVTRKLGEANLYYAKRQHEEAVRVLKEVVVLAPNLSETYHTLGLVYEEIGDMKKATNFYMLAAHVAPKEHASLWKRLVALSIEQGNTGQATHCLSKAIRADPDDIGLRLHRAQLHIELGEYQKAAESYHHIVGLCPENVEARKMAAEMYCKCNQAEQSISVLEEYINDRSMKADVSLVNLLVSIHMENSAYAKALQQIEHVRAVYYSNKQLPLYLTVKAGVCQVHLGNLDHAEILFNDRRMENPEDIADLITEIADTFMNLGYHDLALKYYFMIVGNNELDKGPLYLKIAQCYLSLKERAQAIKFFYKVLHTLEDNIDARLTLASILLEEKEENEAIKLLSPPRDWETTSNTDSVYDNPWWVSGKVKMRLAEIYHAKGMVEDFVNAIFPSIDETLSIESSNQKVRPKKRLSRRVLFERAKVLDDYQVDSIFRGFRPIAAPNELKKALRAKKSLKKKAALKKGQKAAELAAGLDWHSDSDDEPSQVLREPPLPKLLKDDKHYQLIVDLCKALASLRRYWDATQIITRALRLTYNTISPEKKEELRSLGTQIAYNITDGYDYARENVNEHPYSFAAWNCYYKVISRFDKRLSKHSKFLHHKRLTLKNCVPPMIIFGHQLTMISQHQAAAREYLEAYKLMPDNPLINLCVGAALINLALGFRLHNKHDCLAQGFAFLYNNLRLCGNSQEALYNIARACHHVGLVTLAVSYYEKVLATPEKDYPIPKLPHEDFPETTKTGYCNLRNEAAYNLHLIYKKSGALDLARQVLRDYCSP